MKRPPTDIIDLTGEDEEDDIQVLGETAKPLKRSNGSKSSSRAASKSRDDGEESKSRTKKKRKVNGDEADGGETGRSRARSRASRRAPNSSKRRATPSQPTEGTNTSASDSNRIGGPAIIVGADNGDFFVDLEGDERLQPNVVALTVPTSEAVEPKIPSEANEGSKPSDEPHHTVNGWEVLSTPGKRSKSKTPKPLPAVVSETSNSGAVTPTVLPDIAEEADDEETEATTGSKERDKGHSKNAVKKAGRKERDKLAAPSTKGQPQAYGTATPADENSPLFFEDVEGITIAEHLQPDPIEEPLPALVNVDGLILPRHVKLTKEDAKHQGEGGADGGGSDESGSEDTEDDIESDDEDDDRPKGRRYWLTDEQLAAIPPCGICGEQGHDFRDCMHLKCTQCGALDDHESNRCPLFVTCWKCGEKGHVSVDCKSSPNRSHCHHCGSRDHLGKNCHTLWRTYTYLRPEDRDNLIAGRRALEGVPLLQGGEGYLGTSRWCCICGESGHFGYDCDNLEHPLRKKGPMPFSDQLLHGGPFATARDYLLPHAHDRTTNGVHTYFKDVPGPSMPSNPGAQARKKQQQQLQKARRDEEGDDDWFSRRDHPRGGGASSSKGKAIGIEIKGFREREDGRRQREEADLRKRMDEERSRRRDRSRERNRDGERHRESGRDSRDRDYRRRDHDRDYYDSRRQRLDDGRRDRDRDRDRYYDDRRSGRRERSPPRKGKSLLDRMSSINFSR